MFVILFVEKFVVVIDKYFFEEYNKEMMGILKGFNLSFLDIIFFNILYDVIVFCMSIVV